MKNLEKALNKALKDSLWKVSSIDDNIVTFQVDLPINYDTTTEIQAKTMQEVIEEARSMAEMDVDYEASLWIGDDGHGKNGAPYHIKDIVQEMEDYAEALEELAETLEAAVLSAVSTGNVQ